MQFNEVGGGLHDMGKDVFLSYGFQFPFPVTKPIYPVAAVLFYAFTVFYFSPEDDNNKNKNKNKKKKKKSKGLTPFKLFILSHNIILCIFSWLCFINVFPAVYAKVFDPSGTFIENWKDYVCSPMSSNELFWSYLFYLSKIYEFIDTWIIIYKGHKPSTLQTYHHMGAVLACWLQVIVGGFSFYIFVILNSFIHTIMYAYYAASTLGYRFPFKFVITIMQLTQFVVGQSLGYIQYYLYGSCVRTNDFWVWVINSIYVWPLVILFLHFYSQTYWKKSKRKQR